MPSLQSLVGGQSNETAAGQRVSGMPIVKPPTDLVQALEKEVKGKGDADKLRDILDRLGQHSGVNMEVQTSIFSRPSFPMQHPFPHAEGIRHALALKQRF